MYGSYFQDDDGTEFEYRPSIWKAYGYPEITSRWHSEHYEGSSNIGDDHELLWNLWFTQEHFVKQSDLIPKKHSVSAARIEQTELKIKPAATIQTGIIYSELDVNKKIIKSIWRTNHGKSESESGIRRFDADCLVCFYFPEWTIGFYGFGLSEKATLVIYKILTSAIKQKNFSEKIVQQLLQVAKI